jgi:hypothetical protein
MRKVVVITSGSNGIDLVISRCDNRKDHVYQIIKNKKVKIDIFSFIIFRIYIVFF